MRNRGDGIGKGMEELGVGARRVNLQTKFV